MSERVVPFSSGSQYADWRMSNCDRCKKFNPDEASKEACEIDYEIGMACLGDGSIPKSIAERMGFFDNRGSYIWQCGEVEWTDEWIKKCEEEE